MLSQKGGVRHSYRNLAEKGFEISRFENVKVDARIV
jgi:hypothetical protein